MWAYLIRRLLWMIPTILGVLVINFAFLRMGDDPLSGDLAGAADEDGAMDPELVATSVREKLSRARRTGRDLPALINLRGFTDRAEVVEWLRGLVRGPEVEESERLGKERELWLMGRYAVEPLYRVLADENLRELHGPASFAFAFTAYRPLNSEDAERMTTADRRRIQNRNAALRKVRIDFRNTVQAGVEIIDPAHEEKLDRIRAFWQRYGGDYRVTTAERWGAILWDTGFVDIMGKLFTGRLYSFEHKRHVFDLIMERWYVTFTLQLLAIALAWSVSIPVGIRSARRQGTLEDQVTTNSLFLLWSMPEFFVGSLALFYLCTDTSTSLALFPNRGLSSEGSVWMSTPRYLLDVMWHGFLPLMVLSYNSFTALSRYMRGNMLDQITSDYVRTARAKGADENRVIYGHALRNSMVTMITLGSGLLSALFGGFIVVEYIFSINGLGTLLLEAARAQDAPLVMGSVIISVVLLLVSILIADILYAVVDPRIRSRYV